MFTKEMLPYNCPIKQTIDQLSSFCYNDDAELQNKLMAKLDDSVITPLIEANLYNPEAVCRVTNIDTETLNISNLTYPEGYEILTGSYNFTDDEGEHHHFCDKIEAKKELIAIFRAEKVKELFADEFYFLHNKDDAFQIYSDEDCGEEDFVGEMLSRECAEDLALNDDDCDWEDTLEEQADNAIMCDCEFEADEVMWNWAWRYNDLDIDVETAELCGLIVIRIENQEHPDYGDTFVTLGGIGMDMSPTLIAYQAIEFEGIQSKDIHKIVRENDYFKHVVHNAWPTVVKKLGLSHICKID